MGFVGGPTKPNEDENRWLVGATVASLGNRWESESKLTIHSPSAFLDRDVVGCPHPRERAFVDGLGRLTSALWITVAVCACLCVDWRPCLRAGDDGTHRGTGRKHPSTRTLDGFRWGLETRMGPKTPIECRFRWPMQPDACSMRFPAGPTMQTTFASVDLGGTAGREAVTSTSSPAHRQENNVH